MIRRRSRDDDINSFEANGSHKQHDEQYQSIRKKIRPTVDFKKSRIVFCDRFDDRDENARYHPQPTLETTEPNQQNSKSQDRLSKSSFFKYSTFD